jgi:type VI secretion system protein ImpH
MKKFEDIIQYISQMPVDIKFEAIMASFVEEGLLPDDVIVQSEGLFKRRFAKDIERAEIHESLVNKSKKLLFVLNREGLYDALPEGLFHQPDTRQPYRSNEDAIKEIQRQHEAEKTSRKFFLPLEQEFYLQRIALEFEERKFLTDTDNIFSNHFIKFWKIPSYFDKAQVINLIYLLPLAQKVAGDIGLTKLMLECILNEKVVITTENPQIHVVDKRLGVVDEPSAGHARLGMDFAFGDVYEETIPSLYVDVQIASPEKLSHYLPGGSKEKALEYLTDHFVPYETDIVINYSLVKKKAEQFVLSSDMSSGRLGFSSVL